MNLLLRCTDFLLLCIIGAALGGVGGYLSRPSFFGRQIPIDLMLNPDPANEAIASMLMSHMALWVGGGIVGGCILALLISQIKRR